MKVGINLVGVSYNNAKEGGRLRNFEDSIDNFFKNVVNPLKDEGHEVKFYLFSYSNEKQNKIIESYSPCIKHTFVEPDFNKFGGGDRMSNGMKIMTVSYLNSLEQLEDEDLDLVISTRYDINFFRSPFSEYNYDFTKCSFLWREPEFMDLPIVNDTFIVFPHNMLHSFRKAVLEMEIEPPKGVNSGMHNLYLPMVNQVGEDNVVWMDEEFKSTTDNTLYKLERND
jgi:hypothetical protein